MAYAKAASGRWLFKWKRRSRSKTYIVPTAFGLAFGAMAFVMLFMAIGYANNLIYLYVFSLIAMALMSMYLTNKNIDQVQVREPGGADVFANEPSKISFPIANQRGRESLFLEAYFGKDVKDCARIAVLSGNNEQVLTVDCTLHKRGLHSLPKLTLQSYFPFGILVAWRIFEFPRAVWMFPQRKGSPQFPREAFSDQDQGRIGLFRDHRIYQSTDSPRRIDWRASAKTQTLLVKNFEGQEQLSLSFKWEHTRHLLDFEDRLSQLSLWISLAESHGLEYELHLPHFHTDRSVGAAHFKMCMEALSAAQVF